MRKKDLALPAHNQSGAGLPLDTIEFLTTYPGRETRKEIIVSAAEKYQSPKLRQIHIRNNHNELEKSRRAQLKTCLETLGEVVPMGHDTKQTTLGLLTRSRRFIKYLEEREKEYIEKKEELIQEQQRLKAKLEELQYSVTDESMISENDGQELEEESLADFSYTKEMEEHSPSEYDEEDDTSILKKGYEVRSKTMGKEINLADAEDYCLLLDNMDVLENFTYDHELGRIIIHGQLRRENHDEIDMVEVII